MSKPRARSSAVFAAIVVFSSACSNATGGAGTRRADGSAARALDAALDSTAKTPAPEAATCDACAGSCTAGRCLTTLATIPAPTDFAVQGSNVYVTSCSPSGGRVLAVPVGGGAPTTFISGSGCPAGVAVGGTTLYVAELDGTNVDAIELGGGPLRSIATNAAAVVGIAATAGRVYWTTAHSLWTVAGDGGTSVQIATSAGPLTRPVTYADHVYWGDRGTGTIWSSADGGTPTALTTSAGAIDVLAVTAESVYFAGSYIVQKLPRSGGSPSTVGTAAGDDILAIAADDDAVYFTSFSAVSKIVAPAGAGIGLALDPSHATAIAVDATSVYWLNTPNGAALTSGSVVRLTPK